MREKRFLGLPKDQHTCMHSHEEHPMLSSHPRTGTGWVPGRQNPSQNPFFLFVEDGINLGKHCVGTLIEHAIGCGAQRINPTSDGSCARRAAAKSQNKGGAHTIFVQLSRGARSAVP